MAGAVAVVLAVVVLWGAVAGRVTSAGVTAPIVFVAVGAAASVTFDVVRSPVELGTFSLLTELTLALVLFVDASSVRPADLRSAAGPVVRLLALALPLTVLAGWLLATALFGGIDPWSALLVAAALAPTDAALGVAVVRSPAVPARIRRAIGVESGLNDGLATPLVVLAIAGAAGVRTGSGVGGAVVDILVGVAAGAGIGAGGGWLLREARRRGWSGDGRIAPAVLSLAGCGYAAALALGGNGFVAAFVAGLAFGAVDGRTAREDVGFVDEVSEFVSALVWLLVGAAAVVLLQDGVSWLVPLYAVLSLTLVRMVPVAVALAGASLDRATVAFIGWFGPRGLASVVFALLALEELGEAAREPVTVIVVTVLLSVLVHGLSARPLARRLGNRVTTSSVTSPRRVTPDQRGRRPR